MSDKDKAQTADNVSSADTPEKKRKKWPVVVGIVVVVLVVAGCGMWVWHSQPSFCNAFCHTPMDEYVQTYEEPSGQPGTDKWGNDVSNTDAMLAVTHKDAGDNCLSCHVPSMSQQINEVGEEITGNYYYPLDEVSGEDLQSNSGHDGGGDAFCLRSGCHNSLTGDGSDLTRDKLTELTSDRQFNPHRWQHGQIACTQCHKSHRASVYYCTQCHAEAESDMPDGWVDFAQGQQMEKDAMAQ